MPNLLRNGVLLKLLADRPNLRWLFLHNIDTVGADLDPALLGRHIAGGSCLTYEVIPRRIEDRGGGLARVNGQPRLVEGLAMPREEDEFRLRFYNSLSTWIDLDQLLGVFGLSRGDMTALREVNCQFFVVPRLRGQQLKDVAQLDGWLRDGSAAHVEKLCALE